MKYPKIVLTPLALYELYRVVRAIVEMGQTPKRAIQLMFESAAIINAIAKKYR